MAEFVRVERDGAIATIRLDRPPMNALSTQVQDEIAAAAGEAGADPAIRAVVVYGGRKVFAAGAARYAAGPALALRAAKQAIDDGLDAGLATGLEIERLHFSGLFATEDRRAGMRSFIENGPGEATFTGR
jgi:enoyl-CoA hydratase/carnithine racemase